MQIRTFKKGDNANVKNLIISILSKEYPFDKSVYENSDIRNIDLAYGGRRDIFYVIESDKHIVGTVGVKEDSGDTALIRRLFVVPACRRKGYGKLLLGKALQYCRKNGFKHAVFRTTERMIQAINLLKKSNFKEMEKIDLGGFKIYKFMLNLTR